MAKKSKEIVVVDADDAQVVEALSVAEESRLSALENTVREGLDTFNKVGAALAEIRDQRLYRAHYGTFEDYCQQKWQMGRQHAYRLITGAQVVANLAEGMSPDGDKPLAQLELPIAEAHTRELNRLAGRESQLTAWLKAVATAGNAAKVTAPQIKQIVDEHLGIAGRFDPKSYYAVDDTRLVIYDKPYKDYSGARELGLALMQGQFLNSEKRYDGYQLLPIPVIDAPPIHERIPSLPERLRERWQLEATLYPVDPQNKVIYDDPRVLNERGRATYADCEWVSEQTLAQGWTSLAKRYYEYDVQPARTPVDWTPDALLKPGTYWYCGACGCTYEYDQMAPEAAYEGWTCPQGHTSPEDSYNVRKRPLPPAERASVATSTPKGGHEADNGLAYGIISRFNALYELHEVMQAMTIDPGDWKAALTAGNLAAYNAKNDADDPLPHAVLDRAIRLLEWVIVHPDWAEEDASTDSADEGEDWDALLGE